MYFNFSILKSIDTSDTNNVLFLLILSVIFIVVFATVAVVIFMVVKAMTRVMGKIFNRYAGKTKLNRKSWKDATEAEKLKTEKWVTEQEGYQESDLQKLQDDSEFFYWAFNRAKKTGY